MYYEGKEIANGNHIFLLNQYLHEMGSVRTPIRWLRNGARSKGRGRQVRIMWTARRGLKNVMKLIP